MKCSKCNEKAIIKTRKGYLCKDHFIEYYLSEIDRTIKKYKMFGKDDKILLAVSGGKDSSSLAYALNELGYEFEGLYIDLEIPKYSEICKEKVKELFEKIEKKLNIIKVSDFGVKIKKVGPRSICSVCGIIKRYLMNKFAYENGFNVLVTAHNLSDMVSFILNNLYSNQIEYFLKIEPVSEAKEKLVKKARPLFFITEKENMVFALINKIPFCNLECPYSKGNTQIKWKKMFYYLDSFKKDLSYRFLKAMLNLKKYIKVKEKEYYFCKICGYPTGSKDRICSFCKIKNYFSEKERKP